MISDDFAFMDLITGYQPAALITAATRLGVFDAIDVEPRTAADVAAVLATDPSTTAAMLESLHRIGLAERHDDRYAATGYVAQRLTGDGEMRLLVAKEAVFADAWLHLEDVARSGKPAMEAWRSRLKTNPAQARAFLEALDVLARISGPRLEDLPELAPGKKVVDVGGGLGSYARKLVHAGSSVVLVDLPEVIGWAQGALRDLDPSALELRVGDVLQDPACAVDPESMDSALVSHMLHDLTADVAIDLLGRAAKTLRSGGHVVVNDFAGDSGPGAFGPLFDVMMKVETGGGAHDLASLRAMLAAAGLRSVRQVPYPEPVTVLIGETK